MLRFPRTTFVFDLKCRALKAFRTVRKWKKLAVDHRFLFILCPPYAGSSLLHEIICSSPQVSPTNIFGMREGQALPEIRQMVDYRRRWEENRDYPWPAIKMVWLQYWDTSKPVLLDKSPPNLVHAESIQEHFKPAWFIVMTRDPYAHCEGMMRRDQVATEAAARFSIKCLRHQKQNAERLERNCLIRYEELVLDPQAIKRKLEQFMPELEAVVMDKPFTAHNHKSQRLPVTDFNAESIARLTAEQILSLNRVFAEEPELLAYFGYELLSPQPGTDEVAP